ncbi:MAG: parallel beta-helix repeat protein [Gammaproteobacteria bacterium]|jgi:parallel beta-helix repeat protein
MGNKNNAFKNNHMTVDLTDKAPRNTKQLVLRRTALAAAIAATITPVGIQADDWKRNIEFFAVPSNKQRAFVGGQILQPLFQNDKSLTYADLRAVFKFADTEEFNFGIGHRMMFNDDWIFGGYFSFDTRNTKRDVQHHNATFGLEALSRQWDVNFNYYLPITGTETVATSTLGGTFVGSSLFANGVVEETLEGLDFEVGALIPFIPVGETRIFLGAYYFDGDVATSTGMGKKARIEFRPKKNVTIGLQATDDKLFGAEGKLIFKYSFGYANESGIRTLSERMIQFHERDIDIKETSQLPDLDMESGAVEDRVLISDNVIHVDSSAAGGGTGSFTSRFNSVTDALASTGGLKSDAFFYVHEGTTPLTNGFALRDNQTLFGEGANLFGLGGVGNFPVIDAGGSYGVKLANNNEVAGLQIEGSDHGVYGQNSTGFNIHNNVLTDNDDAGVGIQNIAGFAGYGNSSTSGIIADNTITGNGEYGIYLDNSGANGFTATQTIDISGNTVDDNVSAGLYAGNTAYSGGTAMQTLSIANNTFNNNDSGDGAQIVNEAYDTGTATQKITLTDNQFNNNDDDGIDIENDAYDIGSTATQSVTISGSNQFNGNDDDGAEIDNSSYRSSGNGGGTSTQRITISGTNQFNNNEGDGVDIDNYNIGSFFNRNGGTNTQTVSIDGTNQFNNNEENGLNVDNLTNFYGGNAIQTVSITGSNQFNNNYNTNATFHNKSSRASFNATQKISISGTNQFNNSQLEDGLSLDNRNTGAGSGPATQNLTVDGVNQFNNNYDDGVDIDNKSYAGGGLAIQNINLSKSQITGNGNDGVDIDNKSYAGGGLAIQNINLSNSQITGNGDYGTEIKNKVYAGGTAATQTVNLTGADVSGNASGNVYTNNAGGTQTITGP